MKKAAAYIRVSDERQDEFSPDSQLKLIREYCKRNDIELPDELIFYDDGISAKSSAKREQFNNMIAIAKQKEKPFDIILVWKFSRFARNQEESIVYKSLLRRNGVEVISVSEPIQDNPFGGLIERIIEWMDEYYLIRLSDEVRRGMTERATRGKPNCAPPYGYTMEDGEYIINEKEAKVVRLIFDMFLNHEPILRISNHLRDAGIRNHYGNPIDNRGVEYILHNPTYIGYVRWNPNGRSASARKFDNPEDILKKASHEPIVTEDAFRAAQSLFEARKRRGVKYAHEASGGNEYALKGLVRCSSCGATLIYQKAYGNLQCHRYVHGSCGDSHFIKLSTLNQMVVHEMRESARTLSFEITISNSPQNNPDSLVIDFDKKISAERLKLDRARQAYQEGVDSLQEYKSAKGKIEKEIARLKGEKKKQAADVAGIDYPEFAKTVSSAANLLEDPDAPEGLKNEVLKSIIQKIVYDKSAKQIEIHYYI